MGRKQKKKQPVAHHNQPKNQSGFGGTKKNQGESRKGLQQVEHPSSRPIYNKHEICVRGLSPEIKNSEVLLNISNKSP
jgi:hypothetical protein